MGVIIGGERVFEEPVAGLLCISSLQEEDRIIRRESVVLKEKIGARDTTPVGILPSGLKTLG